MKRRGARRVRRFLQTRAKRHRAHRALHGHDARKHLCGRKAKQERQRYDGRNQEERANGTLGVKLAVLRMVVQLRENSRRAQKRREENDRKSG